jgi:hypothetical protein
MDGQRSAIHLFLQQRVQSSTIVNAQAVGNYIQFHLHQ